MNSNVHWFEDWWGGCLGGRDSNLDRRYHIVGIDSLNDRAQAQMWHRCIEGSN